MRYIGTIRGNQIEVDGRLALPDGTRVRVSVEAESAPPRSSPEAILTLAGTLTEQEADLIERTANACRKLDGSLWSNNELPS
jgi:hypothetical protein